MSSQVARISFVDMPSTVAGAERILPMLGTIRRRVYDLHVAAGERGLTADELRTVYEATYGQQKPSFFSDTLRRRRTELREEGLIIDSGMTRPSACGVEVIVWIAA